MDIDQYKKLFLESAREHLDQLNKIFIASENSDIDTVTAKTLHLHIHSLKGEASALEYRNLGLYLTIVELYLRNITINNQVIDKKLWPVLRHFLDEVTDSINYIEQNDKEPESLTGEAQKLKLELNTS